MEKANPDDGESVETRTHTPIRSDVCWAFSGKCHTGFARENGADLERCAKTRALTFQHPRTLRTDTDGVFPYHSHVSATSRNFSGNVGTDGHLATRTLHPAWDEM